jgi:hypothetical protein
MNKTKKTFEDKSCQTDEDLIYNYAWASKQNDLNTLSLNKC